MMNVERRQAAADPNPRPNDLGCESTSLGCQKPHPPSPFTQPESRYSFYYPMEGRRLSRGVQPVPKAVYRSGFYDKPATAHSGIWTLVLSHRSQTRYR